MTTKAEWRARLLAERAAVPAEVRSQEADALASAVGILAATVAGSTVCCYLPFGSEPGSARLVDAVAAAAGRVLLPVVPPEPGPLLWARYDGVDALVSGPFRGMLEPSGPRLSAAEIGVAQLVLVPALAVDVQGVRLGRGAGYYDRSLPLAADDAELVAVVRDAEFVPELPAEPHDVRMTGVVTPNGYRRL